MIINGIDLKEKYGAKILIGQQTIKERTIITYTDWLDEAPTPTSTKAPKATFFDVTVEFIVFGSSKTDAEKTASNVIADCLRGEIQLDNVDLTLRGELKEASKEFVNRWSYSLSLTFQAWDKEDSEKSTTLAGNGTVHVDGNMQVPCIIEISAAGNVSEFTISGASRDPVTGDLEDITVKNITANKKVIIDGETCTVTEDGTNKYPDVDMWEFPTLMPGDNSIAFKSSSLPCTVTFKYKPRYV